MTSLKAALSRKESRKRTAKGKRRQGKAEQGKAGSKTSFDGDLIKHSRQQRFSDTLPSEVLSSRPSSPLFHPSLTRFSPPDVPPTNTFLLAASVLCFSPQVPRLIGFLCRGFSGDFLEFTLIVNYGGK